MLNIAYAHASVVLVIFHYHMLQNKQSDRHSLYSMTSVVVFFAYPIKLNTSTRKRGTKILPKKLHYNFKMSGRISFHKHFKPVFHFNVSHQNVACSIVHIISST